jgi:hypothetical protein
MKVVTNPMIFRPSRTESEGLKPINPIRARLLMVWGPAEAWDNPLSGTKYDPRIRQRKADRCQAERRSRHENRS